MEAIEIVGVRTRLADPKAALADLQAFARSRGGWAQILDADHVVGRDHLVSAYEHARRAMETSTNTTDSLEMELLLHASGERQIAKAIEVAGAKPSKPFVVVVVAIDAADVLRRFGWMRDDSVMKASIEKLRAIGFTASEIEAAGPSVLDLGLERVARVALRK